MLVDADQRGDNVTDTFVWLCVTDLTSLGSTGARRTTRGTGAGRGPRGRGPPHRGGWRGGRGGRGRFGPPRPPQEGPQED